MGCSASKGTSTSKRTTRESWYAPVSRCASAPIHYVPEVEQDHYHFDRSPSTRYSFSKREASTRKQAAGNGRGTLASLLQEDKLPFIKNHRKGANEHAYHAVQRDAKVYACESRKLFASVKPSSKLNPVEEVSESDACDVETINTWELMQGLDEDDDGSRTSSPIKTPPPPARHGVLDKSVSFNTVHGLDSCFAEMGSPVWHRYFSAQEGGRRETLDFVEMTSLNREENKLGANQNPAKSPLRSPLQSPLRSPWRTPPLMKSPIRSPFKSPSSPLFDPSLLAKFEQAVEAVALPHDEWLVTQNSTDGSVTTSTSSFNNHTWVSSETSSDGDSAQCAPKESPPMKSQTASLRVKNASYDLESFKLRCPPKGEDKVVLYFTSLRGVRKTYEECCIVRLILRGLGVCVDERDVWMHLKFREELTELLDNKICQVPKLFIKGRYIGGMEDVRQLHEDGYLMGLIKGLPCFGLSRKACEGCADVRFVPCFTCRGSCKVLSEADHVMRCGECNENGLIMCPLCS